MCIKPYCQSGLGLGLGVIVIYVSQAWGWAWGPLYLRQSGLGVHAAVLPKEVTVSGYALVSGHVHVQTSGDHLICLHRY